MAEIFTKYLVSKAAYQFILTNFLTFFALSRTNISMQKLVKRIWGQKMPIIVENKNKPSHLHWSLKPKT